MTNRKTPDLSHLPGHVTLILMVVLVCACSSSAHAKEDGAVASKKLNSICPGAAS